MMEVMRPTFFICCLLIVLFLPLPFSIASAQPLSAAERAALEAQLAQVQAEEVQAQRALVSAKSQSSSLQNDIKLLTAKINAEQLDIQAKDLTIQTLGDNISTKQSEINSLDAQIAVNKQEVADAFRQIQRTEELSLIEIILAGETLSQYFDNGATLDSLQQNIDTLSAELSVQEASSAAAKDALVVRQNAAMDARYAIQQAQKALQGDQSQQKQLLSISKNNEKAYSALVTAKKKEADAINAKLFVLAGGSNPIPFGQAYRYALAAQKSTGIDPAFLLAILTQETNLGSNQGTCYLTNPSTGAGVSVKSGRSFTNVMNPTRDVPPYQRITSELGVDATHTFVSCPQSIGWGGAMGPAQFIASTWVLLSKRVASAFGFTGMANPWNPQDAFMASALYLTDLGAASGGYTAQSNAACRYYSGSPCSKSALVNSYGTSVMSLASTIQHTEIDKVQQ